MVILEMMSADLPGILTVFFTYLSNELHCATGIFGSVRASDPGSDPGSTWVEPRFHSQSPNCRQFFFGGDFRRKAMAVAVS